MHTYIHTHILYTSRTFFQVFELVHLCTDEALLEVCVNDPGTLGRQETLAEGPSFDLIVTSGEKILQAKGLVSSLDDPRHHRTLD